MKPRYSQVLFDFHGVFTSNVGRTAHALVRACRKYGLDDSGKIRVLLDGLLNRPDGTVKQFLRGNTNWPDEILDLYERAENEIYVPQYRWLISEIAELGASVKIVSNGTMDTISSKLDNWGLNRYIDGVFARGSQGNLGRLRRKPSPEPLEFAMGDLERGRCIYVGDHSNDIVAGREANIDTALVVSGQQHMDRIDALPNVFLIPRRFRRSDINYVHRGVPVREMRELPDIVMYGIVQGNLESEIGKNKGRERI